MSHHPPVRDEGSDRHGGSGGRKIIAMAARPLRKAPNPPEERSEARLENFPRHVPLWLCAHLPRLSLEVLDLADGQAVAAVVEERQGRPFLHAVSQRAAEQGLTPGLPLTAAYALCPGLRIESRQPEHERQALAELAERGLAFTPWVSLDFPAALLLEVRGSLRLFGGLEALTAKLQAVCSAVGHHVGCAATPAPFASWLLARYGIEYQAASREELRSALGGLPSTALGLDARTDERLRKVGIATLRDLWRLPRGGLARRYGTRLLDVLDQAAGYRVKPLRHFQAPPRFDGAVELPGETERLAHFFPAVEVLIGRLTSFLTERDATVAELVLNLIHRDSPPTRLRQGARRPTRDRGQLTRLLHERLERMPLPAPVCAVALSTAAIVPHATVAADLFAPDAADPADWQHLLDHIQARLGSGAFRFWQGRADHRPEYAGSRTADADEAMLAPRPLWLLREPRSVAREDLIHILPETERIESGWWDGAGIRRDYHRAVDRRGSQLWVYRDLRAPGQWYLHGLFG